MSTPRPRKRSRCSRGKSSPTVASRRTPVKKLAAYEKNVAEPPRASRTAPNGVATLSSATDPTTRRSGTAAAFLLDRQVLADEQLQPPARGERDRLGIGDDRVPEHPGARARPRRPDLGERAREHGRAGG